MPVTAEQRQSLELFVTSEELVQLETRFARFNVFEALHVARRELQHSSFLAFLLDPNESHNLGDLFLRRFLQEVTRSAPSPTISVIDLDGIDLSRTEVKREYENIDIFLRDPIHKIVVVIENKVGSKEHDDQLTKYLELVTRRFTGHRFVGVFLTPDGDAPKDLHYLSMSYAAVRSLVVELLDRKSVLITRPFRIILKQYRDLLGRRLMADQELQELCARIYKRHKQAIDILRENIPDEFGRALGTIKELVLQTGYSLELCDNNAVRFKPKEFDIPAFRSKTAWLVSEQMVYVECKIKRDALVFQVKMDGGSLEERGAVHKFAAAHKPFRVDKSVYAKYQVLYTCQFLASSDVEASDDELRLKLKQEWDNFVTDDLAAMRGACVHGVHLPKE